MPRPLPKKIEWEALEYLPRKKPADWFWAVSIMTLALAVTAIIFGNTLLGIIVLLSGFTLLLYAAKPPQKARFVANKEGLAINRSFFPFEALESFCMHRDHHEPHITLKSKKWMMPYIVVPLGDAYPDQLYEFLSHHLLEDTHELTLIQDIFDRLGF